MKRLIIWLALLVPATYSLHADVAETLRSLIDSHDYAAAATAGREYLDANPDAKDAGAVNALLGEALMHSGDREGARERLGLAVPGLQDHPLAARRARRLLDGGQHPPGHATAPGGGRPATCRSARARGSASGATWR